MANLFGNVTPAMPNEGTGQAYMLGTRFTPTVAGQITAARWFVPATAMTGSLRFILYRNSDQAVLVDQSFPAPTTGLGGWQEFTLTAPYTVAVGTGYTIAVLTPSRYPRQDSYVWPITSGGLTTPNPGGYLDYTGAAVFPNDTFSNVSFFVDINFQPSAPAGATVTIWNGTAEIAANVSVWTGSAEIAATLATA